LGFPALKFSIKEIVWRKAGKLVVVLPTPSEVWGRGEIPQRPNSRAMLQEKAVTMAAKLGQFTAD